MPSRDFDNRPTDLLKEIREQFDYQMAMWREIREEARKDMRFVAGDSWDPKERKRRENLDRLVLSPDELGQYVNQLVNEVRQNKRAVQLAPVGNGANDKTAEIRGGIIRHIEYKSNAQNAYAIAFQGAVERSYGFCRIQTRYVAPDSRDQELVIRPIPNPDSVLMDYDAKEADYSDGQVAFVLDSYRTARFKEQWKDAELKNFSTELQQQAPACIKDDHLQVAEYWRIENKPRELLYLLDQQAGEVKGYLDEFKGAKADMTAWSQEIQGQTVSGPGTLLQIDGSTTPILYHRTADWPMVVQYTTNGVEILEKKPWSKVINGKLRGRWIPILACMGKEIYVDEGSGSQRRIMSLIRLARDPMRFYAYIRTCQGEMVGMTPKTPFVMAEGQDEGREEDWQNINRKPLGYITYKPVVSTTAGTPQLLPPPQRPQYDPPVQSLEIVAEAARRAIQSAMGISSLPTAAQRQNQKSGVALERIESQQARGSFHLIDNYDSMVAHGGRVMDDLLPIYYDAAREVGTRSLDEKPGMVAINQPNPETGEQLTLEEGDHDVIISTGPSFESQREEANSFFDSLMQNLGNLPLPPQIQAQLLSLSIRLKNLGPLGDQAADLIAPKQDSPIPPQAQAALSRAQQQIQELTQVVQKLLEERKSKVLELQAKNWQVALQEETKLTIAEMKAAFDKSQAMMDAELQSIGQRLDMLHETGLQMADQQHQQEMQDGQQGHEAGMAAAAQQAQPEVPAVGA
jgi:hypothetical protein